MRVSTKLSFEDQEYFKEAVGSLCFNNSQSASDLDLDAIRVRVTASGTFESDLNIQRMGSILPQGQERSEDIRNKYCHESVSNT